MAQTLFVKEITQETPDFKTFTLVPPPGESIGYKAGQYLTLLHPHHPEEIRRSYSIVSSPELAEELKIGVKRIPNGIFSRLLIDSVQVGDELLTIGAAGFFTFPEDIDKYSQVFFLAAGSGITPVLSLLKTVLFRHPKVNVVLIYSNSSPETALYLREINSLLQQFPLTFKLEAIYSNAADLQRAHLHRELLVYFLKKYAVTTPENTLAFTCGPKNYMRMCIYGFSFAGIPKENIRKEIFNVEKAIPKVEPPDKSQHLVKINFGKQAFEIPVTFPVSILHEAKRHGIHLPYSCEAGRCGNCVARCLSGNVWMSYNEVLTERELKAGLFLTCVGFPVGGNLEIEV